MAARVLLIEDDPSIARFVEMALEDLSPPDAAAAVSLQVVRDLAAAAAALAAGDWQLVISDLMLPDGSAETLLAQGHARAGAAPPWIIFSAGVNEARRQSLFASGVARVLHKPVPLQQLLDTVAELLWPGATPTPAGLLPNDPVQQHFAGDRELFERFRAGCVERFADDIAEGEAAVAASDVARLRRVAHGLKAVLELIGQPALAAQARALEDSAAAWAPGQALPGGWPALAQGLAALRGDPPA